MKNASRVWSLLAVCATALALGGCHHSNPVVGQTVVTPQGSIPWAWVGGTNLVGRSGVYNSATPGLLTPGGRDGAASWMDTQGNLWVMGGVGYDVSGAVGNLNDLWEYTGGSWKFVSGSTTINAPGVYNLLNTPVGVGAATPATTPGARSAAATWLDSTGNLWLFGGIGVDANGLQGDLNDLWEFSPSTGLWTWVSGSMTANAKGVYAAATGVPASQLVPGARDGSVAWLDATGNFWLFGGGGYDSVGNNGLLNDLWKYNPTTGLWTFVTATLSSTGTVLANAYPTYGTAGTAAATNFPGSRQAASGWIDKTGNLWLFGGNGFDSNTSNGYLNDVWKYVPSTNQWTWVSGSNIVNVGGNYSTQASFSANNAPGGRAGSAATADSTGNFWLFGGQGYDGAGTQGYLNDLWEFSPSTGQWQYLSGSALVNGLGNYPTLGAAGATTNSPGARYSTVLHIDASNNLWVFGGAGYDSNAVLGDLNDLWKVAVTP